MPAAPPPRVPPTLTAREQLILHAIGRRLTNQEIAEGYSLSKRTVEGYVSALYRKLGLSTRRELVGAGAELALTRGVADPAARGSSASGPPRNSPDY